LPLLEDDRLTVITPGKWKLVRTRSSDHETGRCRRHKLRVHLRQSLCRVGDASQVCTTLPEMEALADDLADNKNKQTRRLATTIMHDVVPPLFARELVRHRPASLCSSIRHHLTRESRAVATVVVVAGGGEGSQEEGAILGTIPRQGWWHRHKVPELLAVPHCMHTHDASDGWCFAGVYDPGTW
jgi:hypothetical protein